MASPTSQPPTVGRIVAVSRIPSKRLFWLGWVLMSLIVAAVTGEDWYNAADMSLKVGIVMLSYHFFERAHRIEVKE